jgi:hypothetical protein
MDKTVISQLRESQIMPSVTVTIPMPQGAAAPAQAAPQAAPAQTATQAAPTQTK